MADKIIDIPPDAGRDVEHPELLYKYADLEKGGDAQSIIPSVIDIHKTDCQNQYTNPRTRNCCTVYGGDHTRKNSTLDDIDASKDAEDISIDMVLPAYPYVEKGGRSMTGFLQLAKNTGLIHGFAILENDIDSFMKALFADRGIYCGSNKIDFAAMKAQKVRVAIIGSGPGHIWSVDKGDTDEGFMGVHDSEGDGGRYGTGHFRIKIEDFIKYCYTKVIFLNKDESSNLQDIMDNNMIKKAKSLGITNGNDLDVPISRQQAAVMIVRAMEGESLEYDFADQKAIEKGVYNGLDVSANATREQLMLMVASMLAMRDKSNDDLSIRNLMNAGVTGGTRRADLITRRDAIIMITRAYIVKQKQ